MTPEEGIPIIEGTTTLASTALFTPLVVSTTFGPIVDFATKKVIQGGVETLFDYPSKNLIE